MPPPPPTPTSAHTAPAPAWASPGPEAAGGGAAFLLPALVLLALGGLALWLRQRRPSAQRYLQVLETTSLGPKRALIVARLGDETLVLGSSEAGLTLLATRPFSEAAPAPLRTAPPSAEGMTPLMQLKALFAHKPAVKPTAGFESLLQDSVEDEELRRKLAQGRGGRVS